MGFKFTKSACWNKMIVTSTT